MKRQELLTSLGLRSEELDRLFVKLEWKDLVGKDDIPDDRGNQLLKQHQKQQSSAQVNNGHSAGLGGTDPQDSLGQAQQAFMQANAAIQATLAQSYQDAVKQGAGEGQQLALFRQMGLVTAEMQSMIQFNDMYQQAKREAIAQTWTGTDNQLNAVLESAGLPVPKQLLSQAYRRVEDQQKMSAPALSPTDWMNIQSS